MRSGLGLAAVLLVLALALAVPATASARASYCSPTGDYCIAVGSRGGVVYLDIRTAARYFSRYRLCVTAPNRSRRCRGFSVRRLGRVYGSSVRWSRHFPRRGRGIYRAVWSANGRSLGPTLSFRVR